MSEFNDDMTLQEARDKLRELIEDGEKCPCCTQFAKVYKRKIHASMASALLAIYRASRATRGNEMPFIEISKILPHKQVADAAKLRYWGLIQEEPSVRSDGSERTGFWRITQRGVEFARNRSQEPKYAKLYDGRCLGFDGGVVTIKDALGKKFDYGELMAGI